MDDALQAILGALASAMVLIIGVAAKYLVEWIKAKTAELKAAEKSEELNKLIDIAEDAVITGVGAVEQTLVKMMKNASETGKLSENDIKEAFTEAKNRAILIMGEKGKQAVIEVYNDFDAWIENKIEFYVLQTKLNKTQP